MAITRVGNATTLATYAYSSGNPSGKASLKLLSNGTYVAVLERHLPQAQPTDPETSAIDTIRFDASGNATTLTVASGAFEYQSAGVVETSTGGFSLVYDRRPSGDTSGPLDSDIFAQTFTSANVAVSGTVAVSNVNDGELASSSVRLANGNTLAIWVDSHGTAFDTTFDFDVYARVIDASGNQLGAEYKVNAGAATSSLEFRTSAVSLSDGRIFVSWVSNDLIVGAGGPEGIDPVAMTGRFLASDGTPTGTDVLLHTFAAGYGLPDNTGARPQMMSDGNGGFWLLWSEDNGPQDETTPWNNVSGGLYLKHLSSTGAQIGSTITIDSFANVDFTAVPTPVNAYQYDDMKLLALPNGQVGVYFQTERGFTAPTAKLGVYDANGAIVLPPASIENLGGTSPMGDVLGVEVDTNGGLTAITSVFGQAGFEIHAVQLQIDGISVPPPPDFYDWRKVIDFEARVGAQTATQFAFANKDGTRTVFNGMDFTFDPTEGNPLTGQITSLQLTDGDGTVRVTVTQNLPTIQALMAGFASVDAIRDQITWRDTAILSASGVPMLPPTATRIEFSNFDGTRTVMIGIALAILSDGGFNAVYQGTVNEIQHVGVDGTTVLTSVTGLSASLTEAWAAAFTDTYYSFDVLFAGNHTISGAFPTTAIGGMLNSGSGNDTIIGGAGVQIVNYVQAAAGVDVNLLTGTATGGAGTDTLQGSIEHVNGSHFDDTLRGNNLANIIKGRSGIDVIYGEGGADDLEGGAGDDSLFGGEGNDSLTGNEGADHLDGGNGNDTVSYYDSAVGVTINFANQVATGGDATGDTFTSIEYLEGSNHADNLTGDATANNLYGLGGIDLIDGGGGADRLYGGLGDDFYVVQTGAGVYENAGEGVDTVFSTISYTLTANVENLQLFGAALNGRGNALNNVLQGNSGANVLDGLTGSDVMQGYAGHDRYYVDVIGDSVVEGAGEGTDAVLASINYTLTANVENLYLIGTALDGLGNVLNNYLYGNDQNNWLNGLAGNDRMQGGLGNDTYFVDATRDVVVELVGAGYDTISTTVSYVMSADVEQMVLAGTANLNGTGGATNNRIQGNAGNNLINGGLGNDTLIGGAGLDSFVFSTALAASNIDFINDFSVADDRFLLDDAIFTAIGPLGRLASTAFVIGAVAADASDRIIYNNVNGGVYYDADGTGAAARQHIFSILPGAALTISDFVIY